MTKRKDVSGKRALFESPPIEIDDSLKDDPLIHRKVPDSHEALYSTGEHESGTVVVSCSRCDVRSRIPIVESVIRILAISVWVPGKTHAHWMQCPSCQTRSWCAIDWTG